MSRDASNYGIGAAISHITPDGQERPILFASQTLTSSECNYSPIEKEALSLVYGVKKFHGHLFYLLICSYDVEFRPTQQHSNANMLSRLPLRQLEDSQTEESEA